MGTKPVYLQNVTKQFVDEDNRIVDAVSNVDLTIEAGEFITLLGPSGCGKTTTLRMIAGFEDVTEGEIYFGDDNVNNVPSNKRDCTMVFQSYAIFPHLTVYDNVAYGLKIKGLKKEEIKKRVTATLNKMNLADYINRMPNQLSGGQQQRVALARALVMEPSVLLFDEPLSNLDAKLRLFMRDEIRRIQKEVGITSIYVTHDQSEAMSMSDKIIVMNNGKIEQVGSPRNVYQRPKTKFVADFIGTANFISGRVHDVNKRTLSIETVNGIFNVENCGEFQVGDSVLIVCRPEAIRFIEQSEHIGIVTKSVFMGNYQEYDVAYGETTLNITVSNPGDTDTHREGDEVFLHFPRNSVQVIHDK